MSFWRTLWSVGQQKYIVSFRIQSLTKEPCGKKKQWIFWNHSFFFGTEISDEQKNSEDDKNWKIHLESRLWLTFSLIFLGSMSAEDGLGDKMSAYIPSYLSNAPCWKNITNGNLNVPR